jgi:hypothetical protein
MVVQDLFPQDLRDRIHVLTYSSGTDKTRWGIAHVADVTDSNKLWMPARVLVASVVRRGV